MILGWAPRASIGLLALSVLASAGQATAEMHARPRAHTTSCSSAVLYVAFYDSLSQGTINTYNQADGSQCNSFNVPDDVHGLFVDPNGDLWVAWDIDYGWPTQTGGAYMYAPGATTPSVVLDDPSLTPSAIAVGPDGTVYLGNWTNNTGRQTNIEFYAAGATEPTGTLLPPQQVDELGRVAIDRAGNVYAHFFNPTNSAQDILEWKGAKDPAVDLNLPSPGGSIQTMNSGALLVCGGGCYAFDHDRAIRHFAVRRKHKGGQATLDADAKRAFVTDGFGIEVWPYPRGGRPLAAFPIFGDITGIAASPAAPLGAPYDANS